MAAAGRQAAAAAAETAAEGSGGGTAAGASAENAFRVVTFAASRELASELAHWMQTQAQTQPQVSPAVATSDDELTAPPQRVQPDGARVAALQPLLLRPACEALWLSLKEGAAGRRLAAI